MKEARSQIMLWSVAALLLAGCSYYNTFYNIKKDFRAAEKQSELSTRQQQIAQPIQNPRQQGQPQPRSGSAPAGVAGYQAVIESCSELLEFYPKSRWVDDALLIMGISYYRMHEYSRSERKFSELLTIFPGSKHVSEAKVWRARALIEQGKFDEAEKALAAAEGELNSDWQSAAAYRALALVEAHRGADEQAIGYYEKCVQLSYDRDEKATDFLHLGKLHYKQGSAGECCKDLLTCIRMTRDSDEAYEANLLFALASRESGEFQVARETLENMLKTTAFLSHEQELRLELAVTESQSENSDAAIALFQEFIDHAPIGDPKGRAYYLQGTIERDQRREFELAKGKFDSSGPAGASRSLTDSARSASEQLSHVIQTLVRLPQLLDSVHQAEIRVEEFREAAARVMEEPTAADTTQPVFLSDTSVGLEALPDTAVAVESMDTVKTPAELAADSIMRALASEDSFRMAAETPADSADGASEMIETVDVTQESVKSEPTITLAQVESELTEIQSRLIASYMDLASFYSLVLADGDSSEYFLRKAISRPSLCEDYSRAKVQLALNLAQVDSLHEESLTMLREVAADENAPIEMRNRALGALEQPLLEVEVSEQERLFSAAESAYLSGQPVDSVLLLYNQVLQYDSLSLEGMRSLQAIAFLSEYSEGDFEKAKAAHAEILRLFPDSTFSSFSQAKLAEPDTNSIFLASDEELSASSIRVIETLDAPADSSGWPPAEETLRGRRFQ